MIHWQTAKRWTYKGKNCEIQRASVAGDDAYRGLVAVETGLSDRALDAAPVAGVRRKRRRERTTPGRPASGRVFSRPTTRSRSCART